MEKTFSHAGVSTLNGEMKARFANDATRVKVLTKNGHKDIDIIELPNAMTKEEAVKFLLSINFDNGNATVKATLEAEIEKRTETPEAGSKDRPGKEPKKPKQKKEPKPKAEVPAAPELTPEQAALEEQPF